MSSNPLLQDGHIREFTMPSDTMSSDTVERRDRFSIDGTIAKTLGLFAVLVVGAFFGWQAVEPPSATEPATFPGWILPGVIVGFVLVVVAMRKPSWAKVLGPAYAAIEGLVVGAISHAYDISYEGIVLQAVIATVAVSIGMLLLYTSGAIRVTPKLRRGVMIATAGIMIMYGFQLVMHLFGLGASVPFLHDSGPIGILISLAIVGVAAFNLLVDFDSIEAAAAQGVDADFEWTAALGLLVTIVWLYLEILRLLSKLRD